MDIQSAFVADTYRVSIVSLGMRTYEFQSTGIDNRTVPVNVIVIADTAEAAPAMNGFQIFCGKGTVCRVALQCTTIMLILLIS